MIIVSQDKKTIVNFDKVKSIWIDDNVLDKTNTEFEICAGGETLGYYKTEERAKEVLEDISLRYEAIELCKLGYTIGDYTPIYEMPKE